MWWILLGLAHAQAIEGEEAGPTIDVTGVGEVMAAPDEAVLALGVRAQAERADAAFDDAAERARRVMDAVAALLPAERIRTTSLSLQARYEYSVDGAARLVGYEAATMLQLRIPEPADVGAVLDAAVAAGADEVAGVRWVIADATALEREALAAAVADARATAELVATELDVTLGDPLRISIRDQRAPAPAMMFERAAADADAGMPVSPGEQAWRAEVDVTFEILGATPGT